MKTLITTVFLFFIGVTSGQVHNPAKLQYMGGVEKNIELINGDIAKYKVSTN